MILFRQHCNLKSRIPDAVATLVFAGKLSLSSTLVLVPALDVVHARMIGQQDMYL